MSRLVLNRFMARVSPEPTSGCWLWTGRTRDGRYGAFDFDNRGHLAHRAAYQLLVGDIADGLCVCHRCDNTFCVNPSHLFLGTQRENVRDRENKGRGVVPHTQHQRTGVKLLPSQRTEIRSRRNAGESARALALAFGVSVAAIHRYTSALDAA